MSRNEGGTREYTWSTGRGRVVAAATVGTIIERIQETGGGKCPATAFVEAARPAESEVHCLFEWDDSVAAEAYRVDQARGIIRSLRVTVVSANGEPEHEPRPAFVSVEIPLSGASKRGYVPVARVMTEEDLRVQAVGDCLKQLLGLQRRYAWLTEFNELWEELLKLETEFKEAAAA